jgi:hypothetical protein
LLPCASASRTDPVHHPVGCDLGERDQYERALEQARMRDFEIGFGDLEVAIKQHVQIDHARSEANFLLPVAAEAGLDLEQARAARRARSRRARPD